MTLTDLLTPLRRETDRGRITGRLGDIFNLQQDVVLPHSAVAFSGPEAARLSGPILMDQGVYDGLDLAVTRTALRQVAERLRVPVAYLDRLAAHDDMVAYNLNTLATREDKPALLRLLGSDEAGWLLRAVVSDRYRAIDNLDVLNALMLGMQAADAALGDCEVDADWTSDRFRLRIAVPSIALAVPDLLGDYRPPFSMSPARGVHDPAGPGEVPPVMWAGLEVTNSETGGGALRVAPRAVVLICRNGLTRAVDMLRQVHIGGPLDEGVVDWSSDTRRRALELTTSQVTDAVRQFVSVEYLATVANEMRAAKGLPVDTAVGAVAAAAKTCSLTEAEAALVLDAFARSGDHTVFGLAQAVTVAAQHAPDGDRQAEMEQEFWRIVAAPAAFVG